MTSLCLVLQDPAGIFDLIEVIGNGTYGQVYKVRVSPPLPPLPPPPQRLTHLPRHPRGAISQWIGTGPVTRRPLTLGDPRGSTATGGGGLVYPVTSGRIYRGWAGLLWTGVSRSAVDEGRGDRSRYRRRCSVRLAG